MYIIYIAHTPGNFLKQWIPARFGFSDATEIFVFCSGMASALAFATVYRRRGWTMGTARIAHRVWQVYWAHIAVFFVIAGLVIFATAVLPVEKDYVSGLNLQHFFNNPSDNLLGLLTLTYVPNYFDILPMYLVILALVPIVMALGRVAPWAAGAGGRRLVGSAAWNGAVAVVRKVGQQSLAVFLAGLVLARMSGMALDHVGGGKPAAAVATVIGCAILTGVAYMVGWFKSQPWRRDPAPTGDMPNRKEAAGRLAPAPGE